MDADSILLGAEECIELGAQLMYLIEYLPQDEHLWLITGELLPDCGNSRPFIQHHGSQRNHVLSMCAKT